MRDRRTLPILEGIGSFYQSFFLRDLLGFTLPGFIAGISLWWLMVRPACGTLLECTAGQLARNVYPAEVVVVVGASYLIGLALQAVHFAMFDWVVGTLRGPGNLITRLARPLLAFREYTRTDGEDNVEFSQMSTLILASDRAVAAGSPYAIPEKVRHALVYHERLGVLTVTRQNLALAALLFLIALGRSGIDLGRWWFGAYSVVALVYLEALRTAWFRILRLKLYVHD